MYVPVTFAGMSTRGTRAIPTSVYALTGFDGATPGLMLVRGHRDVEELVAEQLRRR